LPGGGGGGGGRDSATDGVDISSDDAIAHLLRLPEPLRSAEYVQVSFCAAISEEGVKVAAAVHVTRHHGMIPPARPHHVSYVLSPSRSGN